MLQVSGLAADPIRLHESNVATTQNLKMQKQHAISVETIIVDVNVDQLRELGVSWRLNKHEDEDHEAWENMFLRTGQPEIQENTDQVVVQTLGDKNGFMSRIRALESQDAVRIVSTSKVDTTQNVETELLQPPFNVSEHLFIRPKAGNNPIVILNSEGVSLHVTLQVGDQSGLSTVALQATHSEKPVIVDQRFSTNTSRVHSSASVHSDDILLIGGMARVQGDTALQPSIQGNKPIPAAQADKSETSNEHIERIYLISPEIIL